MTPPPPPPPSPGFYLLKIRKIDRAGVLIELPSLHARVEHLHGYGPQHFLTSSSSHPTCSLTGQSNPEPLQNPSFLPCTCTQSQVRDFSRVPPPLALAGMPGVHQAAPPLVQAASRTRERCSFESKCSVRSPRAVKPKKPTKKTRLLKSFE